MPPLAPIAPTASTEGAVADPDTTTFHRLPSVTPWAITPLLATGPSACTLTEYGCGGIGPDELGLPASTPGSTAASVAAAASPAATEMRLVTRILLPRRITTATGAGRTSAPSSRPDSCTRRSRS